MEENDIYNFHSRIQVRYTVPFSLPAHDKSTKTNRRDFCMPICSAALNKPSGSFPQPRELSKGLLLPNDHYALQSMQPALALHHRTNVICTICEANNNSMFFKSLHQCMAEYFGLFYFVLLFWILFHI